MEIPRCPFYGYALMLQGQAFIPTHGNQCALVRGSFAPCHMERERKVPDWGCCSFYNRAEFEAEVRCLRKETVIMLPGSAEGVSFELWYKTVEQSRSTN